MPDVWHKRKICALAVAATALYFCNGFARRYLPSNIGACAVFHGNIRVNGVLIPDRSVIVRSVHAEQPRAFDRNVLNDRIVLFDARFYQIHNQERDRKREQYAHRHKHDYKFFLGFFYRRKFDDFIGNGHKTPLVAIIQVYNTIYRHICQ